VLMAGEGRPAKEIAERVGCSAETVRRQRARYEREGLRASRSTTSAGGPAAPSTPRWRRLDCAFCVRVARELVRELAAAGATAS
jgi:transposase